MDLNLLRTQVARVCSDPLWVSDRMLCSEMSGTIDSAVARVAAGDREGAAAEIDRLRALAEQNREPMGRIRHNAYWLLELNGEQVARRLRGG